MSYIGVVSLLRLIDIRFPKLIEVKDSGISIMNRKAKVEKSGKKFE